MNPSTPTSIDTSGITIGESRTKWRVYRALCLLRFGYFSFLVMLSILLFSFTILMELFFAVFLPSARHDPYFYLRSFVFLVLLPLVIISLSWVFEESCRFFLDCISSKGGGSYRFRMTLTTFIHYFRVLRKVDDLPTSPHDQNNEILLRANYPPIQYSTFVIVDLIIPLFFELLTLTFFTMELTSKLSFNKAFARYIRVGFFCTIGYLLLWIILHFWTNKNGKMASFLIHCKLKTKIDSKELLKLQACQASRSNHLETLGLRCMRSCKNRVLCCCATQTPSKDLVEDKTVPLHPYILEKEETLPIPEENKYKQNTKKCQNPWSKLSFSTRMSILIPLLVGSAVVSFFFFYVGWSFLGVLLIVTAHTMSHRFKRVFGRTFRIFVTVFALLSFCLLSSTWLIGTFVIGGEFQVYPPTTNTSTAVKPQSHWMGISPYPICDFNYSSIDIIDLVLIADAVYGVNTSIQQQSLNRRFHGTMHNDFQYVTRNDESKDVMTWIELYFPKSNITVIAVRGTASATDALEDMHYWFGIGLFQTINKIFPFLSQLPEDFVVNMLGILSLEPIMPEPIYMKLIRHTQSVMERVGPNNLLLVGHSLGGAMAALVGSKLALPAISFSGPGLLYTRGRFELAPKNIHHFVITVKPKNDLVPNVDFLGGLTQDIDCPKTNPVACHSTVTHACELYYACGDSKNRDWSRASECKAHAIPEKNDFSLTWKK